MSIAQCFDQCLVWLGFGLARYDFGFLTATAAGEFVVVIDPGHGGKRVKGVSDGSQAGDGSSHNNATAASGKRLEKDMTLDFSLAAAKALRESEQAKKLGGVKVVLTREDVRHLAAMMRAAIATQNSADVAGGSRVPDARGAAGSSTVGLTFAVGPARA